MKKSSILALSLAMAATTAVAQNAQEVTYTEDPSQGVLLNKFENNWFIQAEGGVPGIEKCMCRKEDVLNLLSQKKIEVLITLGAGDIDNYVPAIAKQLAE